MRCPPLINFVTRVDRAVLAASAKITKPDAAAVSASLIRLLVCVAMNLPPARIAVLGATGAVGRAVCRQLADAGRDGWALARRDVADIAGWPARVVDFSDDTALGAALTADAVICALGTTQAKAGRDGLRAVDHDLVLRCAALAVAGGARCFTVVSALGASTRSPSYYSRVKGQMEAALTSSDFETVHIVRPSLLLGERDESRPAEAMGQGLAPFINPLLPRAWRAIDVDEVARALITLTDQVTPGVWVHTLPLSPRGSRRIDG